jgi:hypothetical protein
VSDREGRDPAHAETPTRDAQEREVAEAKRERSGQDPHGELSNPVRDPDPTEHPDPYEKRPDPRDPDSDEDAPRPPSTSDPPGPQSHDREHYEGWER